MRNQRMVSLGTLPPFQARLLAARLGAEGILWQLRGESSVYPIGGVEVLVEESRMESAKELLNPHSAEDLFGEMEGAAEPDVDEGADGPDPDSVVALALPRAASRRPLQFVVWLALLLMIVGLMLRVAHVG